MNEFQLWYVYFDALFLKRTLRPTKIMLTSFSFQYLLHLPWPIIQQIPQISQCFNILQNFIKHKLNWSIENISQQIRKKVQDEINNILILLLIQKQYAIQYWGKYKRRIQASICHLYIFIQKFALSLIPNFHLNLQQCQQSQNLCIKLILIQQIINQLLTKFNYLYKFMVSNCFSEEKQLTIALFDNFGELFRNLHLLRPNQVKMKPKLLKYVNIINPIEISQRKFVQKRIQLKNRGKSITIGTVKGQIFRKSTNIYAKKTNIKQFNGQKYEFRSKRKSTEGRLQSESIILKESITEIKSPELFYFVSQKDKKNTLPTIGPVTSINGRRDTSQIQQEIIRPPRFDSVHNRKRNEEVSVVISQKTQRRKKKRSQNRSVIKHLVAADQQNQRLSSNTKILPKIVNTNKTQIKNMSSISPIPMKQVISLKGVSPSKGWRKIQDYVHQKIVDRKIKKLLSEE